jgi:hypothetical protein
MQTLDTEKARQGHTGDGVRYVLGFSLTLAALAALTIAVLFAF